MWPVTWWLRPERICLKCRRQWFDPWLGKIPWRRKWQPTSVFLPKESHAQRGLLGYSPWSRKELDMTERLSTYTVTWKGLCGACGNYSNSEITECPWTSVLSSGRLQCDGTAAICTIQGLTTGGRCHNRHTRVIKQPEEPTFRV